MDSGLAIAIIVMAAEILPILGLAALSLFVGLLLLILIRKKYPSLTLTPSWVKNYKKYTIMSFSVIVVITALMLDFWPGNSKFDLLCESEAGVTIHRYVEGVQGIRLEPQAISQCSDLCARLLHTYRFVEMRVALPRADGSPEYPGIYRFTLADSSAGNCQNPNLYGNLTPEGKCIAAQPVGQFQARYLAGPERYTRNGKVYGYGISSTEFSVFDTISGEVLGVIRIFTRKPNWSFLGTSTIFESSSTKRCPEYGGQHYLWRDRLILETLRPIVE